MYLFPTKFDCISTPSNMLDNSSTLTKYLMELSNIIVGGGVNTVKLELEKGAQLNCGRTRVSLMKRVVLA